MAVNHFQRKIKSAAATLSAMLFALVGGTALADIAVIVHPDNPLQQLSENDVQRIFMGRTRMFPNTDVGIESVDLSEAEQTFVDFYSALVHFTPAKLKRQRASYLFSGKGRLPLVLEDDAAMLAYIAKTSAAIGYIAAEKVDDSVKVVYILKN